MGMRDNFAMEPEYYKQKYPDTSLANMQTFHMSALNWLQGFKHVPRYGDYEAFVYALKMIAGCDGVVSKDELTQLIGRLKAGGTPDEMLEKLIAFDHVTGNGQTLEHYVAKVAKSAKGNAVGKLVVFVAVSISISDLTFEALEKECVRKTAAQLGLSSNFNDANSDVSKIWDLAKNVRAMRIQRIRLFGTDTYVPTTSGLHVNMGQMLG